MRETKYPTNIKSKVQLTRTRKATTTRGSELTIDKVIIKRDNARNKKTGMQAQIRGKGINKRQVNKRQNKSLRTVPTKNATHKRRNTQAAMKTNSELQAINKQNTTSKQLGNTQATKQISTHRTNNKAIHKRQRKTNSELQATNKQNTTSKQLGTTQEAKQISTHRTNKNATHKRQHFKRQHSKKQKHDKQTAKQHANGKTNLYALHQQQSNKQAAKQIKLRKFLTSRAGLCYNSTIY